MKWFDDGTVTLYHGDAGILATLPDESVQCIVTSPPYFRQRDYDISGQLGQEATVSTYVSNLVRIFGAARRVLRSDGTFWINLGDKTIKKQLVGAPWKVAFALQDDGWILRMDNIWHKPNGMPDGALNRPTRVHEYVFLFSKGDGYYYDREAVLEPHQHDGRKQTKLAMQSETNTHKNYKGRQGKERWPGNGKNLRSVWTIPTQPFHGAHFAVFPEKLARLCVLAGSKPGDMILDPFVGSGTTCLVARELDRKSIGIDLSEDALRLAATQRLNLNPFLIPEKTA